MTTLGYTPACTLRMHTAMGTLTTLLPTAAVAPDTNAIEPAARGGGRGVAVRCGGAVGDGTCHVHVVQQCFGAVMLACWQAGRLAIAPACRLATAQACRTAGTHTQACSSQHQEGSQPVRTSSGVLAAPPCHPPSCMRVFSLRNFLVVL